MVVTDWHPRTAITVAVLCLITFIYSSRTGPTVPFRDHALASSARNTIGKGWRQPMDGRRDEAARVAVPASPSAATPSAATPNVTLADDGRTLNLAINAHFLLALGWDYDWRVEITDPRVVGRVINISVVRGAQGVYEAREPGTSDLVATGIPVCRSATPPCSTPTRTFRIHLIITRTGVSATPAPW